MEKPGKSAKDDLTSILHQLLQTKDTINSRLLLETKHSSELANQMSTAEAQLRELTETALRNLRSEFEKKKMHSTPLVRRLENSLKE